MPIYEYECLKCGKTTEAMQKISDPPVSQCCHCRGEVRKLISMSTFHLKGSGWYVTDYAGKNQSTSASTACETAKADTTEAKSTPSESSSSGD